MIVVLLRKPADGNITPQEDAGMETLLASIALWLSTEFGLPAAHDYPRVELVSAARMDALQRGGASAGSEAGPRQSARKASTRSVEALYDDASRTIYLSETWTPKTSANVSVLVHEMVHHLQRQSALKFECSQAREQLAYAAQDRWLEQHGSSLAGAFKVDPVTLLVRTKCMS